MGKLSPRRILEKWKTAFEERPSESRPGLNLDFTVKLRIGKKSQENSDAEDNVEWESHRELVFFVFLPAAQFESTCSL